MLLNYGKLYDIYFQMGKVLIKGKNFLGFEIEIKAEDINKIKKELDIVISSSAHFLKNTIVTLKLTEKNKLYANDIIKFLNEKDIDINAVVVANKKNCAADVPIIETRNIHLLAEREGEQAATFKGNLRNGQTIRVDGDLIVAGNVNSNSYIYATGNIFVLGNLDGIPHAGYGGNNEAVIFAFSMNPPQIRIGDFITRSPEEGVKIKNRNAAFSEVAYVSEGNIVISTYEEWLKLKR